ncbi:hypothetical protein E3N88_30021 [Mikania micrantha]|uniref:Uncharacterized protein n=1 Tax=Mikania micrantha TaxID=192012 RepID=A0A5N6ML11_9ASTR|nr:hypothetical protein E3N88_30021 [Mikania micrantha]
MTVLVEVADSDGGAGGWCERQDEDRGGGYEAVERSGDHTRGQTFRATNKVVVLYLKSWIQAVKSSLSSNLCKAGAKSSTRYALLVTIHVIDSL